ncbi:hypothetical protein [Thiolapillus sp.]|uniref:hypothetical protein n=1 Tax=Thiolapillus sp. TaxID=2017437 RepID=UPI0025F24734
MVCHNQSDYKIGVIYFFRGPYLQTMANQGYNPLVAIQMAFSGQLYADRGE